MTQVPFNFLPPEMQEEITKQVDRQHMYHDSIRHDIERLFDELTRDQLVTFRLIFNSLSDEQSGRLAAYYEGITSQTLKLRFNVCGGCGKDHTQELLEATETTETKDGTVIQPSLFENPDEMITNEYKNGTTLFTENQLQLMEKYNIDDLRDEKTHELLGFLCKNCGMRYATIEDRLVREVDGCIGCEQKAKWG